MKLIQAGATEEGAAEACGWSYDAFKEWMRRGLGIDERESTPEYVTFATAIMGARASARVLTEAQVRKQDPRFWLTRRYPAAWPSERLLVQSAGNGDSSVSLDVVAHLFDEPEYRNGKH